MSELTNVWGEVESLLSQGLSIIAVRDKDEEVNGKFYAKKSSYWRWKTYQNEIISKDELWKQMEKNNTSAIAVVCGPISGNLEVIDIDTKWKEDAGILLFKAISDFDQKLFDCLRIHKTPSGGYHILYRIENPPAEMDGNTKLAGRMPTDEEIAINPKAKPVNFLETRANGGYVLAPPAMGYVIHKDNPIPKITLAQRNDLINISKTFDTIIKVATPTYKPTVKTEGYYDESPWDDFNNRCEPVDIMIRNGWLFEPTKEKNNIYFTRPGKTTGISMSFRNDIRKFYCFTASTEFEPSTAYSPVDVILKLEFNDDKKALYSYLISNGYGKVKPKAEQSLAVSLARKNKPLPGNFSHGAITLNQQTIERLKEDYPFGAFIKYDGDEEKQAVSRQALLDVANNLGFRFADGLTVQIRGNFIYEITEREFQDLLKDYIREEDPDEYENLCNIFESFMQKNGSYTMTRLPLLDASLILKDRKDVCYKFYKNGYLTITADEIEFSEYDDNDLLIWHHSVQPRNYVKGGSGDYIDFINKSTINHDAVKRTLGYLSHEYKDETTGYIIVLTETCPDPKNGGGSGKNVFCNLLKLTTSYTSKPGAQAKFDEKFFQSWNRQRIFAISDVEKNFNFMFLKEPSTGVFIWKKLFKDEVEIPVEDGPKFIVQTNYSYEISDGGLARRIKAIEFTDYFTKCGGLDIHYKKHFPDEWNEQDYAGFDTYIAEAVQEWLKSGRKLSSTELSDTGKLKQWEQTFGQVACGFILQHIDDWCLTGYVANSTFKDNYDAYLAENNVPKIYTPSMTKINAALEAYAANNPINFKKDQSEKDAMGSVFKCRFFEKLPF